MNYPILLTIIAAVCYGLSAPIAKLGFNRGMHTDGFLIPYGVGLLIFSTITLCQRGMSGIYPTSTTLFYGLLAGCLTAIGFKTSGIALATPGSLVSVLMVILCCYPLISSAVSIPLFREHDHVVLWKLIVGTLMTIAGAVLVTTSITKAAETTS